METDTQDLKRVSDLAERLDCMTVDDFRVLAGITESTEESWRKRGAGPAFVRLGNRIFYPRSAVADFLRRKLVEPKAIAPRAML